MCEDSTKLTIELSSGKKRKNAKVSLLASYGGFPSGETTADDYVQVDMNDSYFAKLVIGDTGHLPLQPGELLYLTVQKTDTNVTERALYDIRATWDGDCGGASPPDTSSGDIIRLAKATRSESVQAQPGAGARFLWSIPAGTPAALLEATGLTADADIDLISTDGRHYRNSIHLGQAPEQIVLREGDMAPSLEGDWVVQVNTVGDAPSGFTLHTDLGRRAGPLGVLAADRAGDREPVLAADRAPRLAKRAGRALRARVVRKPHRLDAGSRADRRLVRARLPCRAFMVRRALLPRQTTHRRPLIEPVSHLAKLRRRRHR